MHSKDLKRCLMSLSISECKIQTILGCFSHTCRESKEREGKQWSLRKGTEKLDLSFTLMAGFQDDMIAGGDSSKD